MADEQQQTEAEILAELEAIQAGRVAFEQRIRKQWEKGLASIEVKHRNATRRLANARAARIKAEATARAQAKEAAAPAAPTDA